MDKREAVKELYKKAYKNTTYEEYGGFLIYEKSTVFLIRRIRTRLMRNTVDFS